MRRLMLVCFGLLTLPAFGQAQSGTRNQRAGEIEATITAHCRQEWSNDFQMRAYCERQQRSAVQELARLVDSNGGMPEDAFQTAFSGCVRDWPGDYQMMAYCLKQQIKGYSEVARGPIAFGIQPTASERSTIQSHCRREWPDDFQMRSYCEGQQLEGLAFLKDRPARVSVDTWTRVRSHCRSEWPGDYQMQAYCVRRRFGL